MKNPTPGPLPTGRQAPPRGRGNFVTRDAKNPTPGPSPKREGEFLDA